MGDIDIRMAIVNQIRAADPTTAIFEELPLARGEGCADIAAVNGALWGYELKSSRDSTARLRGQVRNYDRIFDYCLVVTACNHLRNVRKIVPPYWGILVASSTDGKTV